MGWTDNDDDIEVTILLLDLTMEISTITGLMFDIVSFLRIFFLGGMGGRVRRNMGSRIGLWACSLMTRPSPFSLPWSSEESLYPSSSRSSIGEVSGSTYTSGSSYSSSWYSWWRTWRCSLGPCSTSTIPWRKTASRIGYMGWSVHLYPRVGDVSILRGVASIRMGVACIPQLPSPLVLVIFVVIHRPLCMRWFQRQCWRAHPPLRLAPLNI